MVVTTGNVSVTSAQRTGVSRLLTTGVPVVVRNHYDTAHLGDDPASLAPTAEPRSNCAPPPG
ncbi:hypothetical protein ACFW5W_35180 [Streptomyces sp. NPDC058783]|uniref:hypothetical protein n=1 Tax=Streptomyces sp. NPDC058783 TaxID=3346633 RepID=UPI00368312DF